LVCAFFVLGDAASALGQCPIAFPFYFDRLGAGPGEADSSLWVGPHFDLDSNWRILGILFAPEKNREPADMSIAW
jgi:hypothetical protein